MNSSLAQRCVSTLYKVSRASHFTLGQTMISSTLVTPFDEKCNEALTSFFDQNDHLCNVSQIVMRHNYCWVFVADRGADLWTRLKCRISDFCLPHSNAWTWLLSSVVGLKMFVSLMLTFCKYQSNRSCYWRWFNWQPNTVVLLQP